jgi:glycosyltransferase involved in cell wall biosynthesis/tetratricopeptide (TPR) repeat protein
MSEQPRSRAVLLTPVLPSDRGNGLAMRAGLFLTGLAEAFAVDVVVAPSPPPDPAGQEFTSELAHRVEILDGGTADTVAEAVALLATPQARARATALRPLPALCRGAPPAWAAQVAQIADGAALAVVFRSYLAPLLDTILEDPDRPAILIDIDDVDSITERRLGRPEEAQRFERLERYYLPQFDHVVTTAAADAQSLTARDGLTPVTAVPNAVRMPEVLAAATGQAGLLFIGNLSYAPNAEAARWLCESVLPLLGEVKVTIAGSRPDDELLALERDERVTVVADPEDVAPLYAAANFVVVPVLRGGGSRLKLIEALAHGRAVVATTAGASGQPWNAAGEDAGVLIADDPETFASACHQLLSDLERARELGRQGRATVAARATVELIAPRIARLGQEAIGRHASSSVATAGSAAIGATGASFPDRRVAPLLSAALIVRDEEAFLGPCLESLSGVADEIVLVDTGSSDATVSIARAHGARVLHQTWAGDFSAPRNLGLDRARGAWVLYIDADERVAALDRRELKSHLARSPAAAMRVLLRPKVHATPYYEYRLWRNDPRVRFTGVMHEQVVSAIHAAAAEDGRPVELWPGLLLEHVGYEGDQRHKHLRNLALLEAQLQLDATNVYNWRHLAQVLEGLGRPDEAMAALERATELALTRSQPSNDGGLAWAELVRMRHERGADVSELLVFGRERWPEHWLIRWMDGIIAEQAGRLTEAESCFRSLLAVDVGALPTQGIAYDARMFGEWAYASLGLTLFRAGRNAEAGAAYAGAERLAPENPEYRIKRALAEGRARQA